MSVPEAYWPQSFDDIIGNDSVVNSLSDIAKDPESYSRTILLTGPYGCGKTTLAELLASEMNVDKMDVYLMNSADYRKLEDARNIIANVNYKPLYSGYSFWIFDEAHELDGKAQDCLLRVLNEPPSHVIFVLCTAEPHRLKQAVLSRCLEFQVDKPPREEYLEFVTSRGGEVDEELLNELYDAADGVPRDICQIHSKIVNLDPAEARDVISRSSQSTSDAKDLIDALRSGRKKTVMRTLNELRNANAEGVRQRVVRYCASALTKNADDESRLYLVLHAFDEPVYANGWAGLVRQAYDCLLQIQRAESK